MQATFEKKTSSIIIPKAFKVNPFKNEVSSHRVFIKDDSGEKCHHYNVAKLGTDDRYSNDIYTSILSLNKILINNLLIYIFGSRATASRIFCSAKNIPKYIIFSG